MRRATHLLPFLAGLAAAQDVYLRNFSDVDESGIPRQCRLAYNVPLEGCRAGDFFPGATCSTSCLFGISKLQADIQLACGGVLVPINTLLAQALLGNLPLVLCPNNDVDNDDPVVTTTTTTRTPTPTPTPSTFTTESSSTTSTTPTSILTTTSTSTSTTITIPTSTSSSSSSESSVVLPSTSRTPTGTDTPSPSSPTETPPEPEVDDEQEEEQEQRRPDPGGDVLNLFPEQAAAGAARKPYLGGVVVASLLSVGTAMFWEN